MQVTELESKGLRKSFKITVDAAQINDQVEQELRTAGERVKIPGFRPGYIPMKILKQRYGKSVQNDVLQKVINRASGEAVAQKKLRPAVTPQVDINEYKEGGDLTFTMSFESFPEIAEINFGKITLERKTFEIDQKRIDEATQSIAERSPKLNRAPEGTKAKLGNVVTIDFKGTIDGVAFDGGAASNFNLELGSGQFIEGFEEQIVGAREGEDVTVNVPFPKNYQAKNLAGKDAAFAVTVKEIHTKEAPALDDEFAKKHGFNDMAAFRDAIRGQLVKEYDNVVRNQLKKQLFDELEGLCKFSLPQGMVDQEFESIWQRLKEAQEQGDESVAGKDEAELRKEYKAIAERRVKLGLLLADVGNKNAIQISREELMQAVYQQARMFPGQEQKVMEFYRDHPERTNDLRGPILEEKAVDFILTKVKFNDTKVAVEDLVEEEEDDSSKKKSAKSSKKSEEESKKSKKKAASGE